MIDLGQENFIRNSLFPRAPRGGVDRALKNFSKHFFYKNTYQADLSKSFSIIFMAPFSDISNIDDFVFSRIFSGRIPLKLLHFQTCPILTSRGDDFSSLFFAIFLPRFYFSVFPSFF